MANMEILKKCQIKITVVLILLSIIIVNAMSVICLDWNIKDLIGKNKEKDLRRMEKSRNTEQCTHIIKDADVENVKKQLKTDIKNLNNLCRDYEADDCLSKLEYIEARRSIAALKKQLFSVREDKRNTPLYKAYLELKERKRELMVQHNAYKSIGWRPYWVKDAGKWFAELNLEIGEVNHLKYENRQQRKNNGG